MNQNDNNQLEFNFVGELFLHPIKYSLYSSYFENISIDEILNKMYYDSIYSGVFMKIIFPPYQPMLPLEFEDDI